MTPEAVLVNLPGNFETRGNLPRTADMTLRCPFCDAALGIGKQWQDHEGESGGVFTSQEYQCAACGAAIASRTTDKVFDRREWWLLMVAPLLARVTRSCHSAFPTYACPRCADGNLLPAVPIGEVPTLPDPPVFVENTRRAREIEYWCNRCSQQCLRHEEGSLNTLAVVYWNCLTDASAGSVSPSRHYVLMSDAPTERPGIHTEARTGDDTAPKAT